MCTGEVCVAEVGTTEIRVVEFGRDKDRLAEVRPAEVSPAEVRAAQVYPAEDRPAEDRPSEVRNYRGLFRPPLIPDIDALSENFEMLCIGHELRSPPVHLTANSRHSWRDESNWAEIGANPAVSPARRAGEYLDEDVEHTRLTRSWDGYVPADSVLVRGYHSINLN